MSDDATREVLAVRYGHRMTTRAESFLNYHLYGEPDAALAIDYYFWVIREPGGAVTLVDTGFAPAAGDRRGRAWDSTPAQALPSLGIDPGAVESIVVTHAHWDHIGNLHQFPAAEIIMARAEYDFWISPLARRTHFAAHAEPGEIAYLEKANAEGRLTLFSGQRTQRPGIELIEVGGHTPGQLIVTVITATGTAVLASDALHFYEEAEQMRPFAILTDLPGMYQAYDLLNDLARQPGTWLVAGHDPLVRERFTPHPASPAVTDLAAGRGDASGTWLRPHGKGSLRRDRDQRSVGQVRIRRCYSVHGTVTHNVPHGVMGYTQTSSRVDIGQIGGKFLAQSSIGRAGRIGWHIALVLCHGGGGDSQSPDTRRGIKRAGA